MTWAGGIRTSAKGGAPVPITHKGKRFGVPRRVTVTREGAKGSPDLRVECVVVDGVPGVREVHLVAKPDGETVRDAHLHSLALDKITIWAFLEHALDVAVDGDVATMTPVTERTAPVLAGMIDEAQKTGRGPSRAELDEVARIYREHEDDAPTAAVALRLGYSQRTASRRVKAAEVRGLLPSTKPGKTRR